MARHLTPQYANVKQTVLGTDVLVAAPGVGKRIVVLAVMLSQNANGTAKLSSGAATIVPEVDDPGAVLPAGVLPWGECADNTALSLVSTAAPATALVVYAID